MIEYIVYAALGLLGITVLTIIGWWNVVKPNEVHVVVQKNNLKTFSGYKDERYSTTGKSGYFRVPSWIPYLGMQVIVIPLDMIRIPILDFPAFDVDRVRFSCDISANIVIEDPITASKRLPKREHGDINWEAVHIQILDSIKEAVRDTTTKSTVATIINNREATSKNIQTSLAGTVEKWGMQLQVLNLTDIKDTLGIRDSQGNELSPIAAMSSIKETAIAADARQKNALQLKAARMTEAEADEEAKKREIQRDREVGIAHQTQEEQVAVAEQKKIQNVQTQAKTSKEKEMDVLKVSKVKAQEIEKERVIVEAEQKKQALIIEADAVKQKLSLEGEGEGCKSRLMGEGEGKAIEAKGIAAAIAKEKEAEALKKYDDASLRALLGRELITANKEVGVEFAKALAIKGEFKFVNTAPINSLYDLMSPSGGAMIGGMAKGMNAMGLDLTSLAQALIGTQKNNKTGKQEGVPQSGEDDI